MRSSNDVIILSKALRLTLGAPVPTDVGARGDAAARQAVPLHEHVIVVLGTWVKSDRKFSITADDLAAMARNFEKRKNDQVVVDYEHASEMPEVARGGPVPAAGWIHQLRVGNGNGDGRDVPPERLYGLVEWTPEAEAMIKSGQYRFFSPAIDWGAKDKETGEPQGPTLTSGALTNHPFLEELPAIKLTDNDIETRKSKLERRISDFEIRASEQGGNVKKVKLGKGASKGTRKVFDDQDVELGEISLADIDFDDDEFSEMAGKRGYSKGPAKGSELSSEMFAERIGMGRDVPPERLYDEAKRLIEAGRAAATVETMVQHRKVLLAEAVKDGKLDPEKVKVLAREQKITLEEFVSAGEVSQALDKATADGKVLPRDRQFFFGIGLENPEGFKAWLRDAPKVINLGTVGIPASAGMTGGSAAEQMTDMTKAKMGELKVSFSEAAKLVARDNPELAARYRKEVGRE